MTGSVRPTAGPSLFATSPATHAASAAAPAVPAGRIAPAPGATPGVLHLVAAATGAAAPAVPAAAVAPPGPMDDQPWVPPERLA
jgi:hypothetical protein